MEFIFCLLNYMKFYLTPYIIIYYIRIRTNRKKIEFSTQIGICATDTNGKELIKYALKKNSATLPLRLIML